MANVNQSKDELSVDDFKEWWKDPRGEWFWEAVKNVLQDHKLDLADMVRKAEYNQASGTQGGIDALDDVLELPRKIIEEKTEGGSE